MKATCKRHLLQFKTPGGTSRGVLHQKETWYMILQEGDRFGIGECGLFRGLSADDVPDYEKQLQWVCGNIELGLENLLTRMHAFPSIQFGLEQAFRSLAAEHPFLLYPSAFTNEGKPIAINGLVWMGDKEYMASQIEKKIAEGFRCLKLKIGALDFTTELLLLKAIRERFSEEVLEIRVDANGAFIADDVFYKLDELASLSIHSIEQPVKPGQRALMTEVCQRSPIPVALDEELIGIFDETKKAQMLQMIQPQYIILKPSLVGGYQGSMEWITLANKMGIGWWVTSALESNIGLNAIAQWTFTLQNSLPQGLGTGGLFTNNIDSPLEVKEGNLLYNNKLQWDFKFIDNICL
jgi:o-succinylbenzoate synthase